MSIYDRAYYFLREAYGRNAFFREGQAEAVEAALTYKNTLIVQRTGWGKSLVYFICAKILREEGRGITIVVSPLLSLMENQYDAAVNFGLKCDILNSTTAYRREKIFQAISENVFDLVFVTPESLFRRDVRSVFENTNIGLFVIDEAHCVSEWGNDFRQEYGNIRKFLEKLQKETRVLATTATANKRVIKDLKTQLGSEVFLLRGSLYRESIAVQVVRARGKAGRYAWILQNINDIPGSGIIYCLTQRDCEELSGFLRTNGIEAMPYYSRGGDGELKNREAEVLFRENKIKAIVATVKLGMGYDKSDISFVIHYQHPSNIVSYYQQIGRAGRSIGRAYAFLMSGREDGKIINHFIDTAFPSEGEMREILSLIEMRDGLSKSRINSYAGTGKKSVEKSLSFLESEEYLIYSEGKYFRTNKIFSYNKKHYNKITSLRRREFREMKKFLKTRKCYSEFIHKSLEDDISKLKRCGICANCRGGEIIPSKVKREYEEKAGEYLKKLTSF